MPIDQPPAIWAAPLAPYDLVAPLVPYELIAPHYHGELATVSADGEVRVNWKHVEETAADLKSDNQTRLIAKLLLAVRDGTDKPLVDGGRSD